MRPRLLRASHAGLVISPTESHQPSDAAPSSLCPVLPPTAPCSRLCSHHPKQSPVSGQGAQIPRVVPGSGYQSSQYWVRGSLNHTMCPYLQGREKGEQVQLQLATAQPRYLQYRQPWKPQWQRPLHQLTSGTLPGALRGLQPALNPSSPG